MTGKEKTAKPHKIRMGTATQGELARIRKESEQGKEPTRRKTWSRPRLKDPGKQTPQQDKEKPGKPGNDKGQRVRTGSHSRKRDRKAAGINAETGKRLTNEREERQEKRQTDS